MICSEMGESTFSRSRVERGMTAGRELGFSHFHPVAIIIASRAACSNEAQHGHFVSAALPWIPDLRFARPA